MQQTKDVFQGQSVLKTIARFAVPTVLSQLIALVYNLADTFFVGHTNDPAQVAALALSFPLFMSMTMVGNLFGIGANSFISRSLGSGERDRARLASTFAFYGAIGGVLVIIAVLGLFMHPILTAIGAVTPESYVATRSYLTWTVLIGGVPTVASLMLGHLIRAEGNTRQASVGTALGGMLNIGLDWLFVWVLGHGARGAAIATALSNLIAFLYLLQVALRTKDSVITLNPARFRFIPTIAKQVILVGIPAAAVIVLGSSANMTMNHFMSQYGDISIAGFGITQKIGSVGIQITVGLTQGIMPLLGYCYGADDIKRLRSISNHAFVILGIYALTCIVVVMSFARPLVSLFIDDPATVEKAVQFVRIWFFCAPGMCFTNLFCSMFQAMGKWVQSLALSVFRQAVILIPLLNVLNRIAGETGLVYGQPVADTISLLVGICIYITLIRKLKPN